MDYYKEDLPDHLKSIMDYYGNKLPEKLKNLSPGNIASLEQMEISSFVKQSVVSVSTFRGVNRIIDCSGVVIKNSGTILTSAKLLRFPPNYVRRYYHIVVRLFSGEVLEAKEEYVDFYKNFAILKVQPTHLLESIKLDCRKQHDENLRISIFGRKFFKVSLEQVTGVLLSHPPRFGCDELLSSTCKTPKDCEGGPIVTESGEVLGISFVDSDGFAHLLPCYSIMSVLITWEHSRCIMYPWFGLSVIQADNVSHDTLEILGMSPDNKGKLLVKQVYSGSPADKLNVCPGDHVISFDESKVFESMQYFDQLLDLSWSISTYPGNSECPRRVQLEIQRHSDDQTVFVAAEILPSTDRRLCICWPFREEVWFAEPLEGSQKAHLLNSRSKISKSVLTREQVQSLIENIKKADCERKLHHTEVPLEV